MKIEQGLLGVSDLATEAKQDTGNTSLDNINKNIKTPQGAVSAGTVALASANIWYAVPASPPAGDYILLPSIENGVGTVRFSLANVSVPSATYGNQDIPLSIKVKGGTSVYFGSTTAGDDINYTLIAQV